MLEPGKSYYHLLGGVVLVLERTVRDGKIVVGRYRSKDGRFFESEFYDFELYHEVMLKPGSIAKENDSGT